LKTHAPHPTNLHDIDELAFTTPVAAGGGWHIGSKRSARRHQFMCKRTLT
jgi:hypothetical protein